MAKAKLFVFAVSYEGEDVSTVLQTVATQMTAALSMREATSVAALPEPAESPGAKVITEFPEQTRSTREKPRDGRSSPERRAKFQATMAARRKARENGEAVRSSGREDFLEEEADVRG